MKPKSVGAFNELTTEKLIAQLRSSAFAVTNKGLHQLVEARFPGLSDNDTMGPTPVWYYERIVEVLDDLRDHYQELIRAWDARLEEERTGIQEYDFDDFPFRFRREYKQT